MASFFWKGNELRAFWSGSERSDLVGVERKTIKGQFVFTADTVNDRFNAIYPVRPPATRLGRMFLEWQQAA